MLPNFLPGLHTFKYIKHNQFISKANYKVQCIGALTFEGRQKKKKKDYYVKVVFLPLYKSSLHKTYTLQVFPKFLKTSHLLSQTLSLNLPIILWGWGEASELTC